MKLARRIDEESGMCASLGDILGAALKKATGGKKGRKAEKTEEEGGEEE